MVHHLLKVAQICGRAGTGIQAIWIQTSAADYLDIQMHKHFHLLGVCMCFVHMHCGCTHLVCIFSGQVTNHRGCLDCSSFISKRQERLVVSLNVCVFHPVLCAHASWCILCISWWVWVGFSAANRLPLWLQPLSWLYSISSPGPDSLVLFQGGGARGKPPGFGSHGPVFCCRQPPWHHPAGFLEADKRPSSLISLLRSAQE